MITPLFVRRTGDDPNARVLQQQLVTEGFKITGVSIEKVFRLEGIDENQAARLTPLFCHPQAEKISVRSMLDKSQGPIVEIGYQRAVTDPELPSIMRGAHALDVTDLVWVRLAHRYQFHGADDATARRIAERHLYNPQVQVIIAPDEIWDTLRPQGEAGPVETIPIVGMSDAELESLSENRRLFLTSDQMRALQSIARDMGRDLTDAEIEMFAQTWSDHCFHTTWKSLGLLQALWNATTDIDHPLVLSVFEDNAGAMAFYDGWALTIKGETHNSPTAVSPYGGIATKHGGVIRDTLGCGQGAKPIGGSTVMGLGDPRMAWDDVPKGALHPQTILADAIRGTSDYTNPMGIPMMFSVYQFHAGYTGKCFALGHSIGFVPADRAQKGHPKPGDLAILIGGKTGRDGLHGATVSSSSMTSETHVVDAAHVQIGHPIEERKFMEAIPVLRDADCLRAVTDLGAAGLSSAAGEMGSETGVWINLARVPLKTSGMRPWEIWISESQERMLLCVPPEKVDEALRLLERYEVPASVIGLFTQTGQCQVVFDETTDADPRSLSNPPPLSGQTVLNLDFLTLRKGCPLPQIDIGQAESKSDEMDTPILRTEKEWTDAIHNVLEHLNVCDQSTAGTRFDNTVQGIVAIGPYGGKDKRMPNDIWAATPIYGKPHAVVTSLGFNPLFGDVDPAGMARLMMIEAISKQVAVGVDPAEIVLCDNFYTPRINAAIARDLKGMVTACCELSRQLGTPFISGKDSSSGTFIGKDGSRLDIPPTLAVMAMGRMPDIRRHTPKPWQQEDSVLMLVGPVSGALGGSVLLDTRGIRGTTLPNPDANTLKVFWENYRTVQTDGLILSASAIAAGGLIRRLFESSLGAKLGCTVDLTLLCEKLGGSAETALFGEMIGAMLVEVDPTDTDAVQESLSGIIIGRTTNKRNIQIKGLDVDINLPMTELIDAWGIPFREVVG